MFLEPVYLNESMLMNCASFLFNGVGLNQETVTTTEKKKTLEGAAKGGGEVGLDVFNLKLAKATGDIDLKSSNDNIQNLQSTMVKSVTLGSLHMNVIDHLTIEKVSSKTLAKKPADNNYVKIKTILKPVDFYSVIQILQLVLPQIESAFDLVGDKFFKAKKGENQSKQKQKERIENAIKTVKLLSDLINQLERDYLESNQLEMIMIDENGNNIGVLDIDVKEKNPKEIKAQLTDGEFYVFGKRVRYFDENSELSLVQRSLLYPLTDLLNKLVIIISAIQEENTEVIQQWVTFTDTTKTLLEHLVTLKMTGPVIRVKALSVCM